MRVLSGIQPSGIAHVGNYFGYMKPNIELLSKGQIMLMVADLHALTTVHEPDQLRQYRRDVATDMLAAGFDPAKGTLFFQSDIMEHGELAWVLSCVSPMGLLERAVAYKDKVEKGIAASVGLFTYPILQAADILLYDATHVPVGKDQKQHIEMARDIAVKFNNTFGDTLVLPEPVIKENVAVVPGTDGQKMSKSYGNTIPLFGAESVIKKAIMGIKTDSKAPEEPKDPDTCVVFQIHKLFLTPKDADALAERYRAGIGYGDAKKMLLETYMDVFAPYRAAREKLAADPGEVDRVMKAGAEAARAIAAGTMEKVRRATGLR